MNDLDIWEQAFKTMNLSENVQFVSRGRLITEASQVEMFNKIQALLNSDLMECSHKWLYSLDPTELNEAEATKVNNLWNLGVEKGFIVDPNAEVQAEISADSTTTAPVQDDAVAVEEPIKAPIASTPTSAFTVLYSAMRNGDIKTGEAYSNSINPRSAKADVISQLERAGYSNIKILAIECGDPDQCGNECSNTFCKQSDTNIIPDYSQKIASTQNSSIDVPSFEENEEFTEDEAKQEIKNAFDKANKDVKELPDANEMKKWLNDHKEVNDKIMSKLDSKTAESYKKILLALHDYSEGKFEESEMNEAKKPSTGFLLILKGLFKIVCTIIAVVGSGIGLSGKIVLWLGKIITAGANKLNVLVKDSESVDEADDKDVDTDSDDEAKDDKETSDDEDKEDSEDKEDKEDKEEDVKEPDEKLKDDADDKAEEVSDKQKEDKELDASEKTALKDSYKKAFKAAMLKCKFFDKSFDDLTLEEKVKFFTELDKAWGTKADPSKFLSDKEEEQLEAIIIKK